MNQPANNAMNRYLKDLKQALCAAPKVAKDDALRDATEFLSNEISSPAAELLAMSEQQAYEHFVEHYGLPDQVANEYLLTLPTAQQSPRCNMHWTSLAINTVFVIGIIGTIYYMRAQDPAPYFVRQQTPPKLSPFTQVDFEEDKILVEYDGSTYEWLGIDGIPVSDVSAFSKKQYRNLWRKRIVEDLVEVLWGMGHKPGDTVKLQLRDRQLNTETTFGAAPMTRANRQSMYGNYPISVVVLQGKNG